MNQWFEIIRDSDRYPGLAINFPEKMLVYGTLSQAENLADFLANYFSGCDYIFYVKGGEGDE